MDYNINRIGNIISTEASKPALQYVSSPVLVSTSTTIRSPTINLAVNNSYLAILAETSSAMTSAGTLPGWTSITTIGAVTYQTNLYYKVLEPGDSGSRLDSMYGGTQYDQMLIFKTTSNQSIRRVRVVDVVTSTTSSAISTTLTPLTRYGSTFIALHYYFNTGQASPVITYNNAMTKISNSGSPITGMNYLIYNKTEPTQTTQTITPGMTLTMRQAAFWLEFY